MNHFSNGPGNLPLFATSLLAAGLALAVPHPAQAQQLEPIRIAVPGDPADPEVRASVRREAAAAARARCDSGGVAAVYRSGARRCQERVIAEAERQLRARAANRLAAR